MRGPERVLRCEGQRAGLRFKVKTTAGGMMHRRCANHAPRSHRGWDDVPSVCAHYATGPTARPCRCASPKGVARMVCLLRQTPTYVPQNDQCATLTSFVQDSDSSALGRSAGTVCPLRYNRTGRQRGT